MMSNIVIVGVELTENEDNALRIEAAKTGLSKRKFARKVICDWLNENHVVSLRKIFHDVMLGVATRTREGTDERKELLWALLALSDGCGELVKLIIKKESAEEDIDLDVDIDKCAVKIEEYRSKLNDFCVKAKITPFPERPVDAFAFELINEYRPE